MAVIGLAVISSCGGDDESKPKLFVDDIDLSGFDMNFYYYEAGQPTREDVNATYRLDFYVTDGSYDLDDNGMVTGSSSGQDMFYIDMYTYSDGTSFEEGEFNIWDISYCNENLYNGAIVYIYWGPEEDYYDYRGYSGSLDITRDGDKFTFTFDGVMLDYQDYTGPVRGDEVCVPSYASVPVSGKLSATSTEINGWLNN